MTSAKQKVISFSGHAGLRQRLVIATIAGRPIRIDQIRADDEEQPGLRDFEVNFLRLLEKVTNGSTIEINYTGTALLYRPGIISGGPITHTCPLSRSIGYYLEALLPLAPFSKKPFEITLEGITNDGVDTSVDAVRTVLLPNLRKHLKLDSDADSLELKIKRRGAPPLGGGLVTFTCPTTRLLKPISLLDPGRVKRIRGIAYAARMSPQMANRMVEGSRGRLTRFVPDVYVYTDVYKGEESGRSPGYGLTLVAETTTGALLSSDYAFSKPSDSSAPTSSTFETPEDLAEVATNALLHSISLGGCIDSNSQWLTLLLMACGPEDVSKVLLGELTEFSIGYLRDIKEVLGVSFKIVGGEKGVTLSCLGAGVVNLSKSAT